jgi:hypothetical protein
MFSPKLAELLSTREDKGDALTRCEQALSSLRQYLDSLTVQNLPVTQLESVLHQYETTGARLDARKKELTRELQGIDAEIAAENAQMAVPPEDHWLRNKAAIGVFAQTPGNVEIALIYGPYAQLTPQPLLISIQPYLTRVGRRSMIFGWTWIRKNRRSSLSTRPLSNRIRER